MFPAVEDNHYFLMALSTLPCNFKSIVPRLEKLQPFQRCNEGKTAVKIRFKK